MDRVPQLLYVPRGPLNKKKRRSAVVAIVLFVSLVAGLVWFGWHAEQQLEGAIRVDCKNILVQDGKL